MVTILKKKRSFSRPWTKSGFRVLFTGANSPITLFQGIHMAHSGSRKVIFAALIGNGLIAVTKMGAATMTGSSAMLSEGIHSIVDTGNQVLLLMGLSRAKRAPDVRHPYGYGKEIYFWSFVVAILIFGVGAGVSTMPRFTVKWKVDPRPSELSTQISPPMTEVSLRQIASPRPVPP